MNQRFRITYAKTEQMRYTGNLDVHKAWERTFRRSKLPLAYSQGFHPQPKIQLACPLPLGFLSESEILDFYITEGLSSSEIQELLVRKVPEGFKIIYIQEILTKEPALPVRVIATRYRIEFLEQKYENGLNNNINTLLNREYIFRKRRNKEYDLRPLIENMEVEKSETNICLIVRLSARQGATGRPEEVLSELGIPFQETRITREKTFLNEI